MKKNILTLSILSAIALPTLAATELPQVVVTANNSEQNLKTVTSPITVITAQEIKEKQAHSLLEVLRSVPGIVIKSNGGLGTTGTIFMRGQGNEGTLVLIDGVEMTNPIGTSGARIEMIPVANIQRIEIVQGPQSGVWGSGAAGVINIITQKTGANQAGMEFGSYGFKQLTASLGAGSDKANFRVNLNDLSTNGYSSVKGYHHSNDGYENDPFNQTDISFSMHLKPLKGHTVTTLIKQLNAHSEYDLTTDPNATYSTDYTDTVRKISLNSQLTSAFSTDVYAQDHQLTHYGSDAKTTQTGLQGHLTYRSTDTLNLEVQNKQFKKINTTQGYYNTAYSANNTNTFGNLVLTEAVRHDAFNKFKDQTTGKVGTKYLFSKNSYLSANYGTAYNAPTLYQLNHGTTQNLKPESSTGYDLNLSIDGITLSYFKQQTDNQISYGGTWPNDYYYNRSGKTTAEGIEFSYQRTISAISTDFNLNYLTQTVKDDNGQWLSHRPDQTANLQLSYYGLNHALVGMETNWVGNKYDKSNKQGANIGNYFVTDLYGSYEVNHAITLHAKIKNLFNEDYTDSVASYVTGTNTPKYVYNNGGTQIFVGVDGQF